MSKTETQSDALRLAALLQCGADDLMWILHCEMLKETVGDAAAELRRLDAENNSMRAAERTLRRMGYQDRGGQEWAPPIGKAPDFDLIDSLRSRIEALDAENKALRARLEIDPSHPIDGIAARDETIRLLDGQILALRADAERYRWLRVQPDDCSAPRIDICHWTCEPGDSVNNGEGLRGDAADQAIDAAMAAAKTGDAA